MHRRLPLPWALVLPLAACAATPQYTATSSVRTASRPENCSFDVLTTRPQRSFDELGVIDFTGGAIAKTGQRTGVPDNAAGLKEKVSKTVCRAGGDAVLADVNGLGEYFRATVIRYTPQ
jgi:hypothetical protein